jgi:hypothetical protein
MEVCSLSTRHSGSLFAGPDALLGGEIVPSLWHNFGVPNAPSVWCRIATLCGEHKAYLLIWSAVIPSLVEKIHWVTGWCLHHAIQEQRQKTNKPAAKHWESASESAIYMSDDAVPTSKTRWVLHNNHGCKNSYLGSVSLAQVIYSTMVKRKPVWSSMGKSHCLLQNSFELMARR